MRRPTLDGESVLYHTWARMYSPQLGRWLAPDPLHGNANDPGSLNRYAYVLNNSVNFVDLRGLGTFIDKDGNRFPSS